MANIKDISRLSGCSKSTVSRYLNHGYVSEKTAEKIKKVIEELNYTPNTFARTLKANKSRTIGTIIPNFIGFSKNITLTHIDKVLKEHQYELFISNSNDNMEDEIKIIKNMESQKLDGIILFASNITEKHYETISKLSIPIVIIGQALEGGHCVIHNDFKAGKLIGEYLLSSPHRNITYLGVGNYDKSVLKRYEGLMSVLDSRFTVNYQTLDFKAQSAYEFIKNHHQNSTTFYVGATDNIAMGAMRALRELNLKVPEEVSVSGFGDYDIGLFMNPNLTTVHFSYDEAGTKATEILLKLIERKKHEPKINILDCHLEIRGSTKQ